MGGIRWRRQFFFDQFTRFVQPAVVIWMKHLIYHIGIYALTDQIVADMVVSKASFQTAADRDSASARQTADPLPSNVTTQPAPASGLNQGILIILG